MTLLIDADWLIYSSCCACEVDFRADDGTHLLHSTEKDVMDLVDIRVEGYKKLADDDSGVIMCFTQYPTFRHGINQDYKANRIGQRHPLALKDVRQITRETYRSVAFEGLEGDDVMALLATNGQHENPVIVSPDKDMRGVPCTLLAKDDLELITRKKADRFWMQQILSGDHTDNIEGLVGVGPKTAEKMLEDATTIEEMWDKVVKHYEKKNKTYADAVMTAQLTRILRDGEYNYTTGEVHLWQPLTLQ